MPAPKVRPELPLRLNDLILPEKSPKYEELVARRRLGRTKLIVKSNQVGKSNATLPENLGIFEYAHLRAPLPKDLEGSEIFSTASTGQGKAQQQLLQPPETYFLMRRSKDGFVSATGMFKITFPWATHADEVKERLYVKSLPGTSKDETAGNVWVSPESALSLAEDYNMTLWVRALLDPAEIQQTSSHSSSDDKPIATPPRFSLPPLKQITLEPPSLARTRSRRSTSPVKSYAMTPSKRRTRTSKEAKEQKEAAQQQLRELEALTAATIREEKENEETEKTKMNGTAPVSTKKRTTRKATKKVEPVAVSGDTEASSGPGDEKQETSQSVEPLAELKERINGAVKDTPTKKEQTKEEEKQEKQKKEEKEEGEEKKDEPADKQDEPKQEEETVQKDEPKAAEETNDKETEALKGELPSSSQKENIKFGVFQTPRKTADPDELPMTIGEMESPGKDAASMIDKAREMLAAVTPQQLKKTFGSPLKNEVKRDDDESEDKKEDEKSTDESTAESAESKKRKVDTLEAEDKETDAATKDSEDSGSVTEERPAKRTRVQLVEQVRRERFRHRGLVGLVTAVGIAGIIPYFF